MERNDYEMVGPEDDRFEFRVWSEMLGRGFYGATLTIARDNRAEAERVYYKHNQQDSQ